MAENDTPYQRKPPITPSARLGSIDSTATSLTLSSADENEANGRHASQRIRQRTRDAQHYGELAERPVNAIHGLHTTDASRKWLRKPAKSVRYANKPQDIITQPAASLYQGHSQPNTQEEDDIAEAIARSLHDSDAGRVSVKTVPTDNGSPMSPYTSRSYTTLGSGFASSATAPQDALRGVLDCMEAGMEYLDGTDFERARRGAERLANRIRKWHGTVSKVVYMSESAELRRTKDLQVQLDMDRDIEAVHGDRINNLNRAWAAKMHKKEQEWQKEMADLKQLVDALQRPTESPTQSHRTNLQRPCFQDEMDHLVKEVETLKSNHAAAITRLEAALEDEVSGLQRKLKHLAHGSAQLSQSQNANDDEQDKEETAEALEDVNMEVVRGNVHMHTARSGSAPCSEEEMSPGKHKLEHGAPSAHQGTDWSPKRTKTGSTA